MRQPLYLLCNEDHISIQKLVEGVGRDGHSQPTHHAGARIHGTRDRVGADVAVALVEIDANHLEVVNVLEVPADRGLGVADVALAHDEVAGGAICDALGKVLVQGQEAV